ncbi:MAG: CRISPR-associated endoribonuclease Cas6 [Candidatus Hydrothermae bacterium]|nr:CRISPR-associated endoribonuclease Cas6 [Candidatus Hydrothermae bacterium]
MRISLKLEPQSGILKIPIHYNHILQAFIYRSLDRALADWLHEEGYRFEKRRFKLFTFSRLRSKRRSFDRSSGTLSLESPIFLKIGSYETQILESLAIHLVKWGEARLNRTVCRFASIEVEMRVVPKGPLLVRAISPITVYRTLYGTDGKRKTYYFTPWEREFQELIFDNLKRKAISIYGDENELPPLDNAYIKPVKVSNRNLVVANFKGTWIKGWTGLYELNLPEPYFTIAYDTGLGAKNSQGFGMVDVVRGET